MFQTVLSVVFDAQCLEHNSIKEKDTDNGGGEDGKDGSNGDGALGIFQVP